MSQPKTISIPLIIAILVITYVVYLPALNGGFLFDDFTNLGNLNVYSRFDGIDAIIRYILSYQEVGPLKRPVSTLTFLFNSSTWPTPQAYWFKLTNLWIHLINGLLLYVVSHKLLIQLGVTAKTAKNAAIINMAIWLLHPLFVSTTMYVIQRMAMLPVTFVLLGFYLYLKGLELITSSPKKSRLYLFLSVYACTLLAALSKENGLILPVLLLLFESIRCKQNNSICLPKFDKLLFLVIPSMVIFLAFIYKIPSFVEGYDIREYTAIERLLTQPRVVMSYLYHLFLPEYLTEGIFTDGYVVSSSLFRPLSTLYALIALVTLIVAAFLLRKKHPLISFSVLFFFTALIIESSIIPLEIYFEHRSYLPALMLFLPLSVLLAQLINRSRIYTVLPLVIIFVLTFTTFLRTNLWSSNSQMFLVSADKFPQSTRAINRKVATLHASGLISMAMGLLDSAMKQHDDIQLRINSINIRCSLGRTGKQDLDELINTINHTKITKEDRPAFIVLLGLLADGHCANDSHTVGLELLTAVKKNAGYNNIKIRNVVGFYEALFNLKLGRIKQSLTLFKNYIGENPAFDDMLIAIEEYIEIDALDTAKALILYTEKILTDAQYNFSPKDYQSELNALKLKIK
jgi:hypothetical protein